MKETIKGVSITVESTSNGSLEMEVSEGSVQVDR